MLSYNKLAAVAFATLVGLHIPAFADEAGDKVVARVGSIEITNAELDIAVSNLDPQLAQLPDDQKRVAALSGAVDTALLAEKAKADGLDATPDYKLRMKYLSERELHGAYFRKNVVDAVKPEDVKARYDKEIANLPKQQEIHARHILVKTEDEAKAVIAALDSGKDFMELAKEKSTDPNKSEGGDLGWFAKGRMVKEFEEAAFVLPKGTYSKTPVKTEFGFHVIKVEDTRIAPPPPFEQVEQQVRNLVMRDKYLEVLNAEKAASKVEILDTTLAKGYDEANKQ